MHLTLQGHDYRYAAEQMMLTLFPEERPDYTPAPEGANAVLLTLTPQGDTLHARAVLRWQGKETVGEDSAPVPGGEDPLVRDRVCQRILKLAFYRAGVTVLGHEPPWGALTGVRPVKIPTRAMERGATPQEAERELRETYRVSPGRAALALDCAQASLRAKQSLREDEVSLYIGIPFCPTRCAYCSFVSADVGRTLKLLSPFLEVLLQEVDATAEELFFDLPAGRTMVLVAPENLLSLCGRSDGLVTLSTPLSRSVLLEGVERALGLAQSVRLSVRPAGEEELIRRAKEWLMEQRGMDEGQAHRLLQQRSMICGRKLAETARLLLEREAGLALYG